MEIIPFFLARSSDEAIHAHSVINSLMQRDQGLSSPEKAPKIEKSFIQGEPDSTDLPRGLARART
jgi:hypothetical protein